MRTDLYGFFIKNCVRICTDSFLAYKRSKIRIFENIIWQHCIRVQRAARLLDRCAFFSRNILKCLKMTYALVLKNSVWHKYKILHAFISKYTISTTTEIFVAIACGLCVKLHTSWPARVTRGAVVFTVITFKKRLKKLCHKQEPNS